MVWVFFEDAPEFFGPTYLVIICRSCPSPFSSTSSRLLTAFLHRGQVLLFLEALR